MWLKLSTIFILFVFFAIVQTSFVIHFSILGAVPNLIFILFFSILFFEVQDCQTYGIFSAIVGGFFLDVASYSYFGPSIVLLLIFAFVIKHILSLLKRNTDKYPIIYFLPLFLISFVFLGLILNIFFNFLNIPQSTFSLSWSYLIEILYNLFLASVFFLVRKKTKLYVF